MVFLHTEASVTKVSCNKLLWLREKKIVAIAKQTLCNCTDDLLIARKIDDHYKEEGYQAMSFKRDCLLGWVLG